MRTEVANAAAALHNYTVAAASLDGRLSQAESALAACRQVQGDAAQLATRMGAFIEML